MVAGARAIGYAVGLSTLASGCHDPGVRQESEKDHDSAGSTDSRRSVERGGSSAKASTQGAADALADDGSLWGEARPVPCGFGDAGCATGSSCAGVSGAAARSACTVTLLATGDVGDCSVTEDTDTGNLVDTRSGLIALAGDVSQGLTGTLDEYVDCFDPPWGRHRYRIQPALGNHDYNGEGPTGYFSYFGAAAGDPDRGYYSYNYGAWHVVAINSNCDRVPGGCDAGSPEEQWLRQDLAQNSRQCTLAYFHHPRYSSGASGSNADWISAFWQALVDYGVELAISGHDHHYERWTAQDDAGNASPTGVVQFVVGTGGASLGPAKSDQPENSLVRDGTVYGVLALTLNDGSYDWTFLTTDPRSHFADNGSANCHW